MADDKNTQTNEPEAEQPLYRSLTTELIADAAQILGPVAGAYTAVKLTTKQDKPKDDPPPQEPPKKD